MSYELRGRDEADAAGRARTIAREQTVELPEGTYGAAIERDVVGRVESVSPRDQGRWCAVVSYPVEVAGDDIPQMLNLLFGNVSLLGGVRVVGVDWPAPPLAALPGPRHGIAGIRVLCGIREPRPLLCSVLKPLGASTRDLARRCHDLALGGCDLIKDDHSLVDPPTAPFAERVHRCQEAVALANARSGGSARYAPNVTGALEALDQRVELARDAGCAAVLISPLPQGLDAVRRVVDRHGVAVVAHPALAGAFFGPERGIAPEILLGDIFRLAGADAVIFPDAGGRFPVDRRTCDAIADHLRRPLGSYRAALPVAAGGIDVEQAVERVDRYGPDVGFLIGGSLYARRDLVETCRRLRRSLGATAGGG